MDKSHSSSSAHTSHHGHVESNKKSHESTHAHAHKPAQVESTDPFQAAADRTAKQRAAIDPATFPVINIDIPSAVTTVVGALPKMMPYRDEMAQMPSFDASNIDSLGDYALATANAHGDYMAASTPPVALLPLLEEATSLRDVLSADANALAKRGFLNPSTAAEFKGATGYRNVAFELIGLSSLLRGAWATIASKTAIQESELERARTLANQLLVGVGTREQGLPVIAKSADDRARAFTLFIRAYDEVRAAIAFIRRKEGDADAIAPSLYQGRGGRRKQDPAAPGASDGSTSATTSGAAAKDATAPSLEATASHAESVTEASSVTPSPSAAVSHDPAMPGGSPFH